MALVPELSYLNLQFTLSIPAGSWPSWPQPPVYLLCSSWFLNFLTSICSLPFVFQLVPDLPDLNLQFTLSVQVGSWTSWPQPPVYLECSSWFLNFLTSTSSLPWVFQLVHELLDLNLQVPFVFQLVPELSDLDLQFTLSVPAGSWTFWPQPPVYLECSSWFLNFLASTSSLSLSSVKVLSSRFALSNLDKKLLIPKHRSILVYWFYINKLVCIQILIHDYIHIDDYVHMHKIKRFSLS